MRLQNGVYCHCVAAILNCQDGSYSQQTLGNTEVTIVRFTDIELQFFVALAESFKKLKFQ